MFCIAVFVHVAPENAATYAELALRHAEASLAEEGCLQFDVYRDPQNPSRFHFHEVYVSRSAADAHGKTPHMAHFRSVAGPLVLRKDVTVWDSVR